MVHRIAFAIGLTLCMGVYILEYGKSVARGIPFVPQNGLRTARPESVSTASEESPSTRADAACYGKGNCSLS